MGRQYLWGLTTSVLFGKGCLLRDVDVYRLYAAWFSYKLNDLPLVEFTGAVQSVVYGEGGVKGIFYLLPEIGGHGVGDLVLCSKHVADSCIPCYVSVSQFLPLSLSLGCV